MNRKHIAGALAAGVVAAFALTPGASGSSCPERAGHACQYGGKGSSRADSSAPQRPKLKPSASLDRSGQQVWRVGDHVMS